MNIKYCAWLVSFSWAAISSAPVLSAPKEYGNAVVSEVRSVYDGDTFKASIDSWPPIIGKSIGIRVAGIDTPEMRGKCEAEKVMARKAKKHTVEFLRTGKVVELRRMRRDKYFRVVADVYVDGESLTESLLKAGLGYEYQGGKKSSWCLD